MWHRRCTDAWTVATWIGPPQFDDESNMIWIGTSGWMYRDWNGRFYPAGLPARDQLAFYTRRFPTVEINRSFYRWPTRDNFAA